MALNTVSGAGTQTSTQNPQTSQSTASGNQATAVQPGTANTLLTTNNGSLPLSSSNLSTVSIGPSNAGQISNPPTPRHHASPTLVGLSVSLFVIAIIMFWLTSRSEKITTK